MDVINELKSSSFDKPIKVSDSAYGLKNRELSNRSKYDKKDWVMGSVVFLYWTCDMFYFLND